MKDFDALIADDLTFIVGGERFTMVYVQPEVMALWEDERAERLEALRQEAKERGEDFYIPNDAQETVERLDARILSFLDEEDHERWKTLRARKKPAVPYAQLKAVEEWMVETQSARPTQQPSPSAPGRGSTGRSSTVRPRSREATPVG